MSELVTLPASLRQRLELAQSLATQNRPQEAAMVAHQAMAELARCQPDLCALLMAAEMGYHGISATTIEQRTTMERVTRTFLGFPIGEEWQPVTTTTMTTRTLRLF